jgi:REP-associated tyrosine transposase
MGRRPREYRDGQVYHLTARGIEERNVFGDDVDRQAFALRLRRVALHARWRIHALCLMDTHYHLVLDGSATISPGMRDLNGGHARAFNARHGRRGSLFEQRYTDSPVRDEGHLAATVRYVWANPVRAQMVESVEDWPWSTWDGSPLHALLKRCLTP